jgi:hypothetical protein
MSKKKKQKGKIAAHKREGSKLISPFNQIESITYLSWMNDRLPCMIWAGLLISALGRKRSLEIFRDIGFKLGNLFKDVPNRKCKLLRVGLYGLTTLDEDLVDEFFETLFYNKVVVRALKPLSLINTMPMYNRWGAYLCDVSVEEDILWLELADAVTMLLDHQTQESTDCRWAYLLPIVSSGKFHLQTNEQYKQIFEYPYLHDQTKVRPFIRSLEMQVAGMMDNEYFKSKKAWADKFWKLCKEKTDCLYSSPQPHNIAYDRLKTRDNLNKLRKHLIAHFLETDESTHIQPKRDSVFGFAFYAITVSEEALLISSKFVNSKTTLRILAEIYITFSYLVSINDKSLWKQFRTYGSGQAKLTFLKLDELIVNKPGCIKKENIENLANEDLYMEFQDIELGNWAKRDLRKMSLQANCKDIYDTYYSWPSAFAHAQWPAIRDTVYTTCHNPLHRLHRIPRRTPRYEDGAENDIVLLLNKIMDLLNNQYPNFNKKASLK